MAKPPIDGVAAASGKLRLSHSLGYLLQGEQVEDLGRVSAVSCRQERHLETGGDGSSPRQKTSPLSEYPQARSMCTIK
ncbi:hypothetical protein ACFL59_13305 [Planctomycetota bacterium]